MDLVCLFFISRCKEGNVYVFLGCSYRMEACSIFLLPL